MALFLGELGACGVLWLGLWPRLFSDRLDTFEISCPGLLPRLFFGGLGACGAVSWLGLASLSVTQHNASKQRTLLSVNVLAPRRSRNKNKQRWHDGEHHGEQTGLSLAGWHTAFRFLLPKSASALLKLYWAVGWMGYGHCRFRHRGCAHGGGGAHDA